MREVRKVGGRPMTEEGKQKYKVKCVTKLVNMDKMKNTVVKCK